MITVRKLHLRILVTITLIASLIGCTPRTTSNADLLSHCEAIGNAKPYCMFTNPEDMVSIPDTDFLIVSEMGTFMSNEPGNLVLFDTARKHKMSIDINWQLAGESWGMNDCEQPDTEAFSPHGIDFHRRSENELALLVVNHGGRETVEFFQIIENSDTDDPIGPWRLQWRGCATPPGDPFINDVSSLEDKGFVVTHMWNKSTPYWLLVTKYLLGMDTGWVWRWHPESGFTKLESASGAAPNGIAVDRQKNIAFVNLYGDDKTIKIDIAKDQKLGEMAVQQPDNITIDSSGQLWIASHLHNPISEECNHETSKPCMLPFEILLADPNTLNVEFRLKQADMPMGYATVALREGKYLYLGSAHGDRIVQIDLNIM